MAELVASGCVVEDSANGLLEFECACSEPGRFVGADRLSEDRSSSRVEQCPRCPKVLSRIGVGGTAPIDDRAEPVRRDEQVAWDEVAVDEPGVHGVLGDLQRYGRA